MQEPDILRLKANVSGTQAELRRPPGPRGRGAAAEEGTPTHKPTLAPWATIPGDRGSLSLEPP